MVQLSPTWYSNILCVLPFNFPLNSALDNLNKPLASLQPVYLSGHAGLFCNNVFLCSQIFAVTIITDRKTGKVYCFFLFLFQNHRTGQWWWYTTYNITGWHSIPSTLFKKPVADGRKDLMYLCVSPLGVKTFTLMEANESINDAEVQ